MKTRWADAVVCFMLAGIVGRGADYGEVAPVLERRCVPCHRAGEIGPMALTTYREVRPWAKAIRDVVQSRRMPPWFVSEASVRLANDGSLDEAERALIVGWVNEGARAGAPVVAKQATAVATLKGDLVLRAPAAFRVAPGDVVEYQYLILPVPGMAVDRWVRRVEIRPSARAVVHHVVAYVREKDAAWLRESPRGVMHVPKVADRVTKADILAVYTPGARAVELPAGMAKKLPAGAEVVLQFHYTAGSRVELDRTSVALDFLKGEPERRVLTLQMGVDDLEIPPGERRYRRSVSGTLPRDAWLVSLMPHMHLRGRAFEFELVGEGGRVERLLAVEPFDFHWQMTYWLQQPRLLRKGTRLRFTGTFDNSTGNRRNPDPEATVGWGEQSWEEMMIGFFDVAVEPGLDKAAFFLR